MYQYQYQSAANAGASLSTLWNIEMEWHGTLRSESIQLAGVPHFNDISLI